MFGITRTPVDFKSQIPAAPSFTGQPTSQTVTEGDIATFTSQASGYPTPTYQWQVDSGGGFGNISGATNRILTLTDVELADDGNEYRCVATNSEGSDTSDVATLTVNASVGNGLLLETGFNMLLETGDLLLLE